MTKTKKRPEFITLPGLGQLALSGVRPLIGILLGLLAGAGLIALTGVNPLDAYAAMLNGAIGNPQSISNVLVRASPLLLGGVGVAIGIKAALWNIGVEGYIYMGAIGAAVVGITPLPVPPIIHITLAILVAMVFAALLFEYVDVAGALRSIARCLAPGAILVAVLQLPSVESAPVTRTRYKSLELLAPIMNLVSPSAFSNMCKRLGIQQIKTVSIPLKKGKAFFVGFYRRKGME